MNYNPINTLQDAAGGYLVPVVPSGTILDKYLQSSGVLPLCNVERTSAQKLSWIIAKGRPQAFPVGELDAIPQTGYEWGSLTAQVRKLACIVRFSTEQLEDQTQDSLSVISQGVDSAFALETDAQIVGLRNGADITGIFDADMNADITESVAYDPTEQDGLQRAMSAGVEKIQFAGGLPNAGAAGLGVLLSNSIARVIRDASSEVDSTRRIYGSPSDVFYGADLSYSNHLQNIGAANRTVGFIGNFRDSLKVLLRNDLRVLKSADASVGGVEVYTTDQVAFRWTLRMAAVITDPTHFVRITTTA